MTPEQMENSDPPLVLWLLLMTFAFLLLMPETQPPEPVYSNQCPTGLVTNYSEK